MGDGEVVEDDIISQIDWDTLFDDIPADADVNLFADDLPVVTESFIGNSALDRSIPSSDSGSSWKSDIEQFLMNEDDENQKFCEGFFSDLFLDAPAVGSDETRASGNEFLSPESIVSDDSHEKDKLDVSEIDKGKEEYDPMSKKRNRQLRNKDSAVRSRERKKMYVKDLELKSKYYEGECRRLERLLQCCYGENQALRLCLQKNKDSGASRAKQESAVLLLGPLLLGSLLWFLGIMCLFLLPGMLLLPPAAVAPENAGSNFSENLCLVGTGNERLGIGVFGRIFLKSKRCKATRTRMKMFSLSTAVLV